MFIVGVYASFIQASFLQLNQMENSIYIGPPRYLRIKPSSISIPILKPLHVSAGNSCSISIVKKNYNFRSQDPFQFVACKLQPRQAITGTTYILNKIAHLKTNQWRKVVYASCQLLRLLVVRYPYFSALNRSCGNRKNGPLTTPLSYPQLIWNP